MNLTIKRKLIGGYTIILLMLIFMASFMTNKFSESNQRLLNIVDISARKVILSNELKIAVLDAARSEKDIMMEKDPERKEYHKGLIYKSLEIIEKKTIELQELVDSKGNVILKEFIDTWANYKPDLDKIISLAMKNENEEAFKISIEKGLIARDTSIRELERLIIKNERSMELDKTENNASYNSSLRLIIALIIACILFAIIVSYWIIQGFTKRIIRITSEAEKIASREFTNETLKDDTNDELMPIFNSLVSVNNSFREVTKHANEVASGNYEVIMNPRSDKDNLGIALRTMTRTLRETTAANINHSWLTGGINQLNEKLKGDQNIEELANNAIRFLCTYLNANIGAIYHFDDKANALTLSGQYAFLSPDDTKKTFALDEGLIGQVAREQKQISLTDINNEQFRITSSILNAKPKHLIISPFLFEGKTVGVLELGRLTEFNETEKKFINLTMDNIGVTINSANARKKIYDLLEETQAQSEELQFQQEELRQMNEELEEQTQNLIQQQEELQISNEELEEQTQALETKNQEVETAKNDIEKKTKQLEISSRYKSEFLANMSHELRTPLNSLLILSKDLSENRKKNLDSVQVESAEIIYKSGNDLLVLINEVLDLSKIEAGKMLINIEPVSLILFSNDLIRNFKHHAEEKALKLICNLDENLPNSIRTDLQRLNQILKNLLSNAIKFTEKGSITINISPYSEKMLIISVTDTGLGIAKDKHMAIFEAFQQADGGTSRKYGGTGLGLSISRELAKLLQAEITVISTPNEGSTFSVILPFEIYSEQNSSNKHDVNEPVLYKSNTVKDAKFLNYPSIKDDRDSVNGSDKVVLVIEDDLSFASILLRQANKKGFKCLAAATGEDGLVLASKYKPQAIILDMGLPGVNGDQVLLELKSNPNVRHIPVHIISANEPSLEPIKEGAIQYLMKPIDKIDLEEAFNKIENFVSRKVKNLLIIEDSVISRQAMRLVIGNGDVKCFEAGTGKEALALYQENIIDCIILDLGLPDMSGFDLIHKLEGIKGLIIPPIIIYTGRELTKAENNELQNYAESIIIKGVKSEDRLLDETALFLHRTISNLPQSKQLIINNIYDKEAFFHAKKILVADDDMRNVFALSKILKERGMEVLIAENGLIVLEMLAVHSDIDLVLIDIMMPEMDGYEAMKQIRSQIKFKNLPVIALTAKAMKDDKQKCIDAGASDYITKPIDIERLLSLMRVWLSN